MKRMAFLTLLLILGAGCATGVPEAVRRSAPGDPGVAQVQANIKAHLGRPVRWGGEIVRVENRKTETVVEILARPLRRSGRPERTDRTSGRFLARGQGFLDPAVYKEKREITVSGTVDGSEVRTIGDHPYLYPLVKAEVLHLWEPEPEPRDVYYYDPFWPYYPRYPWGYPYPYYYPYPYPPYYRY